MHSDGVLHTKEVAIHQTSIAMGQSSATKVLEKWKRH
jgi:hypothetical protein